MKNWIDSEIKSAIAIETKGLAKTFKTYEKPEGLWQSVQGFWKRKYIEKQALAPKSYHRSGSNHWPGWC